MFIPRMGPVSEELFFKMECSIFPVSNVFEGYTYIHALSPVHKYSCFPVGWGCRIHRLHLYRGVRPSTSMSFLYMTLNSLMVKSK